MKRLQRFVIFRLLRMLFFIKELGAKRGVHFEQEKVKGVRYVEVIWL